MTNRISGFCLKTNPSIIDHFTEKPIGSDFKSTSRPKITELPKFLKFRKITELPKFLKFGKIKKLPKFLKSSKIQKNYRN